MKSGTEIFWEKFRGWAVIFFLRGRKISLVCNFLGRRSDSRAEILGAIHGAYGSEFWRAVWSPGSGIFGKRSEFGAMIFGEKV